MKYYQTLFLVRMIQLKNYFFTQTKILPQEKHVKLIKTE